MLPNVVIVTGRTAQLSTDHNFTRSGITLPLLRFDYQQFKEIHVLKLT